MRYIMSWVLLCVFFVGFLLPTFCDYLSLMKCGVHKNCWSHLDVEMVGIIADNIRNETRPCENFWYHACGEWKSSGVQNHEDNFGFVMENYANRMKDFLLSRQTIPSMKTCTEKVRNLLQKLEIYYHSCTGLKTKYPELSRYLMELTMHTANRRQWPNLRSIIESNSTWISDSNFNWIEIIAELRRYGLNGVFIEERATVAFNDSTKNVIEIKMPDEDQSFKKVFEIVNYVVEFGLVDGATDGIWHLATQIFDLEQQLETLRKKHHFDRDASFEEALNLSRLKEIIPNIDWQNYLNILLNQPHVNGEIPIEVSGIGYFRELSSLLSLADGKIVAFYIMMHLGKYLQYVRPQTSPRHCLEHMGTLMPLGLNYIYDRFLYETRQDDESVLQTIFMRLKLQFQEYINFNKLNLNKEEQIYLQRKVDKMILKLGNLPSNVSTEYYNKYFDDANITENFYHNHWEMLRFRTRQQHIGFLRNEVHLNLDTFYVYDDINQIRNAPYFVYERNLLIVPMIFMQLPFFHRSLQPLFQYSLVGFILGHEFNHAFENEGIIMNAEGNESPLGFGIKQKKDFISNVECFEVNKTMSLVERMADVNGFQLAYDTYFRDLNVENKAQNSVDTPAVLEDYTEKQLFFLNFAQFFCGELPEPIDHDRDDVRVNIIVNNMPEFQDVFHCNEEHLNQNVDRIFCEMWRP